MPDQESLEPSPIRVSEAISQSREYWHTLLARSSSKSGLPHSCWNLGALLNNTPAIPHASELDDIHEPGSLSLEGFSVWGTGTTECDINGERKLSRAKNISLGGHKPQYCQLTNDVHQTSVKDQKPFPAPNLLFAMVLGWCYVLSARHIELRAVSSEDGVFYTESQATRVGENDDINDYTRAIPIDSMEAAECRWWAAILSPGCGWRAVLCRAADVFHAPWSCHLNHSEQIQLRHSCHTTDMSPLSPPSAAQAREYLIKFAKRHNAYGQLLVAFAASLTVPNIHRFGAVVTLPAPTVHPGIYKTGLFLHTIPSLGQLAHFMALSCVPNILSSSIFGCFWKSEVECNLVSEWLGPLLQECIPSLLKADRVHTIINMMAHRRPNSAPLWLGMWVTGMIPRLFRTAEHYSMSISLEATHWIASPQSFMDPSFYRLPHVEKTTNNRRFIRREDEYRLLYLTDVTSSCHPSPPTIPWTPFGRVEVDSCAIDVRIHIACGHRLEYQCWTWVGRNNKHLEDYGSATPSMSLLSRIFRVLPSVLENLFLTFKKRPIVQIEKVSDEFIHNSRLSQSSTRNIFFWSSEEGTKPEDAEYWKHPWLAGHLKAFEDDE